MPELHVCPNCGAYVMTDDNICPRCDAPLDGPDEPNEPDRAPFTPDVTLAHAAPPDASVEEQPADEPPDEADPIADVLAEIEAAQADEAEDEDDAPPGDARAEDAADDDQADEDRTDEDRTDDDHTDKDRAELNPTTQLPYVETLSAIAPEEDEGDVQPAHDDRPTMPGSLPEVAAQTPGEPGAPVESAGEAKDAAPGEDADRDAHDEPTLARFDAGPSDDALTSDAPPWEADVTLARLPEDIEQELDLSSSDEPTLQFDRALHAEPPREADVTSPVRTPYAAPVAPPPAGAIQPPAARPSWASPAPLYAPGYANWGATAAGYFQQRVQDYVSGGYRVHVHGPYEATLSLGKQLGALGWVLAIVSIVGALWYVLILALSGFRRDTAYLTLESDGRVYEEGPGAAHVRRLRARAGRRWSLIGTALLVVSLVLAIVLGAIAGLALRQERYRAALSEVNIIGSLYENTFDVDTDVTPTAGEIANAEAAAIAGSIVGGLALVGIWGGLTLLIIGTVHALAYRTRVPPLPGAA